MYFTQSNVWISFYERISSNKFCSSSAWAWWPTFLVLATRGVAKRLLGGSGHASPKNNF